MKIIVSYRVLNTENGIKHFNYGEITIDQIESLWLSSPCNIKDRLKEHALSTIRKQNKLDSAIIEIQNFEFIGDHEHESV